MAIINLSEEPSKQQRNNNLLAFSIIFLALVIGTIGGIYLWKQNFFSKNTSPSVTPSAISSPEISPTAENKDETSDWKIFVFKNNEYGYSFKYPEDWNYRTEEEIRGRIVFSDAQNKDIMTVENPIPGIGFEDADMLIREKVKITQSDKYFTRSLFKNREDGSCFVLVTWNDEQPENPASGMLMFSLESETDPNQEILNKILSTFRFSE